jgi:hypothetical protein
MAEIGLFIIGKDPAMTFQRIYYENKILDRNEFRGCAPLEILNEVFPCGSGIRAEFKPTGILLNPIGLDSCFLDGEKMDQYKNYLISPGSKKILTVGGIEFIISAFIC